MDIIFFLGAAWVLSKKLEQAQAARVAGSAKVTRNYYPQDYIRDDFGDDLVRFDRDHLQTDVLDKGVILGDWDLYNGKGPAVEGEHFEFDPLYNYSGQDEPQPSRSHLKPTSHWN